MLTQLILLASWMPIAAVGYCSYKSVTADDDDETLSTSSLYGKVSSCTWYIRPKKTLASDEYLEIKWLSFKANGEMPSCYNEYVEVYVTRRYYSLGKLCSGNTDMTTPFTMYSYDGYAKISFKLDMSRGSNFKLTYEIRSRAFFPSCGTTHIGTYSPTGTFKSPGWPKLSGSKSCTYEVSTGDSSGGTTTKFIFMDFDFPYQSYCSSYNPSVEIRGSNGYESFYSKRVIRSKACSSKSPFFVTTSYSRIEMKFLTGIGSSFRRGFVAGVVKYGQKASSASAKSSAGSVALVVGIVVAVAFLVILLVILVCVKLKVCRTRTQQNPQFVHAPPQQTNISQTMSPQPMYTQPMYPVEQQKYPTPPTGYMTGAPVPGDAPPSYDQTMAGYPAPPFVAPVMPQQGHAGGAQGQNVPPNPAFYPPQYPPQNAGPYASPYPGAYPPPATAPQSTLPPGQTTAENAGEATPLAAGIVPGSTQPYPPPPALGINQPLVSTTVPPS